MTELTYEELLQVAGGSQFATTNPLIVYNLSH